MPTFIGLRSALAVSVLILTTSAQAEALLSGTVQYDQTTGLYTYDYTVENYTSSTIWNVDVLVGNAALGTYLGEQPIPPGYSTPTGWTMYGAFSGSIASPPYNEHGGFYEWYGATSAIQPETSSFGFSVTTTFAPTLDDGLNDYFLYGSLGVVGFGNVVVPDGANWVPFPTATTPLPAALPLFASGLGIFGFIARRKKAKATG
jgi:hypothetical protein